MLARVVFAFLLLAPYFCYAQFLENKGQWPESVVFSYTEGRIAYFVEHDGITVESIHPVDWRKLNTHDATDAFDSVRVHTVKLNWIDANPQHGVIWGDAQSAVTNFLCGPIQQHRGGVRSFNAVTMTNVWPGVDVHFKVDSAGIKYDYVLNSPLLDSPMFAISGADSIALRNGKLHIHTQCGPLNETIPLAYSEDDKNQRTPLDVRYRLEGNQYRFEWARPFDGNVKRVIVDPQLVVATFVAGIGPGTGELGQVLGFGSDYYPDGRFIGTSKKIGNGLFFPTTIGSYNSTAANYSGTGIVCFNDNGSELLWSTVITANGNGVPTPMTTLVTDNALFIALVTSQNPSVEETQISLPQTLPSLVSTSNVGLPFLYVCQLTLDGNELMNSRCIGTAHLNLPANLLGFAKINMVEDLNGDLIISHSGGSYNPATAGALKSEFNDEGQSPPSDGVIIKITADLGTLHWCTFLGGTQGDYILALRVDGLNRPIVGGVTYSSIEMTGLGGWLSGEDLGSSINARSFLVRLSENGDSLVNGTLIEFPFESNPNGIGQNSPILSFLDFDPDGAVWAYGYTAGNVSDIPLTNGAYHDPGARGFLCKFTPDFTTLSVSARVGYSGQLRYGPNAFMVDNCGYIYTSASQATAYPTSPTLFDAPLTADALFDTGGFYLAVYEPDLTGLYYATLMGGNHIDGSYSKFDRTGNVYQSVCVPSPVVSPTGFSASPGAYATEQSLLYELGLFKIDFESQAATAILSLGEHSEPGCLPYSVELINHSTEGTYSWFIDGEPFITDQDNPVVEFDEPGTYTVALSVFNPSTCNIEHTTERTIVVTQNEPLIADWLVTEPDPCDPNGTAFSAAFTGQNADSIVWNAPDGSTSSETAFDFPISEPGTYAFELTAFDETCGTSQSLDYSFTYAPVSASAGAQTTDPCTLPVVFSGATTTTGGTPEWSVNGEVVGNGEAFTIELPQGEHSVELTVSNDLCSTVVEAWEVTAQGTVSVSLPLSEVEVCLSDEVQIDAQLSQGSPLWSTAEGSFVAPSLSFTPLTDQVIVFTATDPLSCNGADSASVAVTVVAPPVADFEVMTALHPCEPEQEAVFTFTGTNHQSTVWELGDGSTVVEENPVHTYTQSDVYTVQVTVENPPCSPAVATQEVVVEVSPNGAYAQLLPVNVVTPNGDGINDCLFFDHGVAPESNFQDFSLRVFNRWGTLVYEGSGSGARWCPNDLHEGSYVYVVSYTDRCTGSSIVVNQTVQVVR